LGPSSLHDLPTANDPLCMLARSAHGAAGFPATVTPIPGSGSLARDHHATHRIFVTHAGLGCRRRRQGLRTLCLQTAPRMIEVYEAGLAFDHISWSDEAGRCAQVEFRDADATAHDGQLQRPLGHGDVVVVPVPPQRDLLEEAQRRGDHAQAAGGRLALLHQMALVATDLLVAERFGRAVEVPGQGADLLDVGQLVVDGEIANAHVLEHPLA
jgi:hypothetical protein